MFAKTQISKRQYPRASDFFCQALQQVRVSEATCLAVKKVVLRTIIGLLGWGVIRNHAVLHHLQKIAPYPQNSGIHICQNAYAFWHIYRCLLAGYIRFGLESAAAFGLIQAWESMVGLVWTDQLSVGNATIDSEHRNLLNMVDHIIRLIRTGPSSVLPQEFEMLEDWLYVHYANEEKIAQAIKFPFDRHKQAQQYAIKELQHLRTELIAKDGSWSESAAEHYARFLKSWIVDEHIFKLDMQMKPALLGHAYNFFPG